MSLLNLPDDVLEKILSYVSYDEVSHLRFVCRRMNYVCKRVLNRGFHKVERYHAQCLRQVKSQLPRRESERRKHPLARHCDILTAVETRLSLLGMTFMKFMEMNLCCFIPGKVLDEIYKVLRYVTAEQTPVRAHEVLQELRDLSSMAMEHFDEKISPAFRKRKETGPKITGLNLYIPSSSHTVKSSASRHGCGEHRNHKLKEEVKNIVNKQIASRREMHSLKLKVADMSKHNLDLEKKVTELHNMLSTQLEKAKEQDLRIEVLSRLVGASSPSVKPTDKTNSIKIEGSSSIEVKKESLPQETLKRRPSRRVTERARKKMRSA